MDNKEQIDANKLLDLLTQIQNGNESLLGCGSNSQSTSSRQKLSHYVNTSVNRSINGFKTTPNLTQNYMKLTSTTGQLNSGNGTNTLTTATSTQATPQPKPLSEEERKTIDKMQVNFLAKVFDTWWHFFFFDIR